jgi:hypothetical protein
VVLLIVGIVTFIWSLGGVDVARVGDLGLVEMAPAAYWVGIACVSVAFALACCDERPRSLLCAASLLALIVMLYGLATFTEPLARFQTAWLHAGFIEYVGRTGKVLPSLDARYSWPGAFTFGAWGDKAAGVPSAVTLLRFAPLTFALLYLAPIWSIARSLTSSRRACWLTLWIFSIANWVGQEYLSPQALGFLLYLVSVAIIVRWFRVPPAPEAPAGDDGHGPEAESPGRIVRGWRRVMAALRRPDEVPPAEIPTSTRVAGLVLLLFLFGAAVVSHQLTPVFILGSWSR